MFEGSGEQQWGPAGEEVIRHVQGHQLTSLSHGSASQELRLQLLPPIHFFPIRAEEYSSVSVVMEAFTMSSGQSNETTAIMISDSNYPAAATTAKTQQQPIPRFTHVNAS